MCEFAFVLTVHGAVLVFASEFRRVEDGSQAESVSVRFGMSRVGGVDAR